MYIKLVNIYALVSNVISAIYNMLCEKHNLEDNIVVWRPKWLLLMWVEPVHGHGLSLSGTSLTKKQHVFYFISYYLFLPRIGVTYALAL